MRAPQIHADDPKLLLSLSRQLCQGLASREIATRIGYMEIKQSSIGEFIDSEHDMVAVEIEK